ncbi:MAG: sigma-70 family RNA polymerase sigma factor [Isosphaeraceae bacterium]
MNDIDRFASWNTDLDKGGEPARRAKGEICERTWELAGGLARAKLHAVPRVRRWEETDDLRSSLNLRLLDILDKGFRPRSDRHLYNLAAQVVGRLLIDAARRFDGPEGLGANHATDAGTGTNSTSHPGWLAGAAGRDEGAVDLAMCAEFHDWVRSLAIEERELFEMKYYLGMTDEEIAKILGCAERTVSRRWRALKVRIAEAATNHWPDLDSGTETSA